MKNTEISPHTKKNMAVKFITYFLLFSFLFGVRVYYISQKEGLHVDEGNSCSISAYNEYGWSRNYETKHAYTGQELKEITYWDNDSVLNAFGDVGRLYKDNRDSPHTNLYYSALRLWFAGVRTGNLKTIINRACGLNLLFFSISFVLMYFLAKKLFKNDLLVFLTLFLAFINTGSISNTLFIRPYQLQETCFIAITLLFVIIVSHVRNREPVTSWKNYFICVFFIGIALLSGYFAVFYIALLGLVLIYTLCKNKQAAAIPFWMLVFLSSLVFATVLYPGYFHGFFSFRGSEALNKLGTNAFLENFKLSIKGIGSILVNYLFYLPVLILVMVQGICFFIFKKKSVQHNKLPFFLFLCAFIWCFIIMFFSPYKTLRYAMPSFPLLIIGLVFYFDFTVLRGKSFFVALYVIIFILGVAFANGTGKQHYLSYSNIENIYHGKGKPYVFNKYPEIPVAVVNSLWWQYSSFIPYLNDRQEYYFFDNISDANRFFPKTAPYYLVIEDKSLKQFEYQIPEDITRIAYVPPFTIFSSH